MTDSKGKPQLHVTAIDMFHFCGEQFRRRYVEGEKIPPGVAAIVGSGTDAGITKNLQNKIDKGKLLKLDQIKDIARDAFELNWNAGVLLSDDEAKEGIKKVKGEAVDKTLRLSSLHLKEKAKEIKPIKVQRGFSLALKGYPVDLVGTIDINEKNSIRDTKTSAKTPASDIADKSTQLTAYMMAIKVLDGRIPEFGILDYLVDLKTPKTVSISTTRSDSDFKILLLRLENMLKAIDKGIFLPATPRDPMCSKKYCGFYNSCPYTSKK